MLNGKFQDFQRASSGYSFAGIEVANGGQIATNGLVHKLNMVAPFYLNIYETINSSGNETDSLSKYLRSFDQYTFDRANSTATGKNAMGQLVYDSVFVYENEWMRQYGDLTSDRNSPRHHRSIPHPLCGRFALHLRRHGV